MRAVVVGAGIAGLSAAHSLVDGGVDVTVVDKGRGPGGRLATRRIGAATVDHGAQFFTVRTPAFGRTVDDWTARGLARVWSTGFDTDDAHPRYCAPHGMNGLAKDLAARVTASGDGRVVCSTMAFAIGRTGPGRWQVVIDDGSRIAADAVVVTTPLPQAFSLLADTDLALDDRLLRTDYDRTLALLAVLDRPPAVPAPGGVQAPTPDVAFVADNQAKGVSAVPALTLHASATWSEAHWDGDRDDTESALIDLAAPWLAGTAPLATQVKRWRFATPRTISPDPCWVAADAPVVLAGDAFAGPRVEGAHNSGLAAAHALLG